jgi:hypothetical protein
MYAPLIYDPTEERVYEISWPFADIASIEVYEIQQSVNEEEQRRERVRYQDLVVTADRVFNTWENPRGEVRITRPHPSWANKISVERNTLIDQTLDLPDRRRFDGRSIEWTLDKHTMIAQELVQRKCTAITSIPITQEINFTAYDDYKASVVNFAVDKLVTILYEISQTAVDCKDDLENA